MKTIFFALVVITLQTVHSHSVEETAASIQQALEHCADSLHLNKDDIIAANDLVELPEDDADTQKWFMCYVRELGIIDGNDDYVRSVIENLTEVRLLKITSQVPDGAKKAHDIAFAAVEHCIDTPKQSEVVITGIKMRNCVRSYTAQPQLL